MIIWFLDSELLTCCHSFLMSIQFTEGCGGIVGEWVGWNEVGWEVAKSPG